MSTRNSIFAEISAEREYQDSKWGGAEVDDRENGYMEWVGYITKYATRWFPGGFAPWNEIAKASFRESMIKVAALAVAAVEQYDREAKKRRDEDPRNGLTADGHPVGGYVDGGSAIG